MVKDRRDRDDNSSDKSSEERRDAPNTRNRKRSESSDDSRDNNRKNDKKGKYSSDENSGSRSPRRESQGGRQTNGGADRTSYEVYFGDVSFNASEGDVKQHFRNCGEIVQVKMLMRDDGKSRGRGFIKFADEKGMRSALKLNGTEFMGRRVVVEEPMNKSGGERKPGFGGREGGNQESSSVIVRNLPFNFTDSDLNDMFESYGAIKSFRVIKNESGQSKGFGFVDFESGADARSALAKSGTDINGRSITVDFSLPKGDRPYGGGRGGYGGDRGGYGGRGGGRGGYGGRGDYGGRGGRDDYGGRPQRSYGRDD